MPIRIEISEPDARLLLDLLRTAPDSWPDVIDELDSALNPATHVCPPESHNGKLGISGLLEKV